jgi:integrase
VPLQKLQPAHLQTLYSEKLASGRADGNGGLAPRTVQYLHRILREALHQAVKWQLVNRNVADATEPPRAARAQVKVWNDEQVRAFLAATQKNYYAPIWHLALTTGLRRGELLGLRWEDVDFEDGVLRVRQSLVEVNGTPIFQEPKTKSGRRTVALFPVTLAELRAHRTRQLKHRLEIGPAWEGYDLVFASADGRPIYPANLARHFRRLVKELQLPAIPFHSLRHTHATLMLRDGMHVKVMSERLGHSSIAITLDTYSHVLPDMQRHALELMNESIFATG